MESSDLKIFTANSHRYIAKFERKAKLTRIFAIPAIIQELSNIELRTKRKKDLSIKIYVGNEMDLAVENFKYFLICNSQDLDF